MNEQELRLLQKLARLQGLQPSYLDISGHEQHASVQTLQSILAAMEVAAATPTEVRQSLALAERSHWNKIIEPVIVSWDGKPTKAQLRIPAKSTRRHLSCQIQLEDGKTEEIPFRLDSLPGQKTVNVDGSVFISAKAQLPQLPIGYHHLEIEGNGGSKSLIIAAPTQSYSAPTLTNAWGLFLPMYAAHSRQSWGAGNFSDWAKFTEWVGSLGGSVVGSLPILAAFLDEGHCEPSPYSPASRLFWNEFFIDVTHVPEFAACAKAQKLASSVAFQKELKTAQRSKLVDYSVEMSMRRKVLELLSDFFFSKPSERRKEYNKFLKEHPHLIDYAQFRATCERTQTSWHNWPERMRKGTLRKSDFDKRTTQYHAYVQFLAQEQMNAVLETCQRTGTKFYLDLPLGVNPDGYDVWREHESFALDANVGAPPDLFFTKGQDWGFSPLHPQKIRENHYRYVLGYLRFQMRHTGLLRIDHIMALYRLYWVPKGQPASEGAYVHYPADELFALLSLESHRNQTAIVGENLGTVPPEINKGMAKHHLRQMYVVQYQLSPNPLKALTPPARRVVASLNTHDMPPFAAFWRGDDIADRFDLGLIKKADLSKEKKSRRRLCTALAKFLKKQRLTKTDKLNAAAAIKGALRFLAKSDAEILLINLEDLWCETASQNVPGTSSERPNWRRKARFTLEQIMKSPEVRALLAEVDEARHA